MSRYRPNGKVAYVTGGSSGIGLAVADELAARGASVLLLARDPERLARTGATLAARRQSATVRVAWRTLDVTDPDAVRRVVDTAAADFGPPDILVNSAGRMVPGAFLDLPLAELDATMRANVHGTWSMVAAAVPHMKARGGGYVVNVASVAGFLGIVGYTAYSASKFAVLGFSEALRNELAPHGVRVSVLCPPDTDTPGLAEELRLRPAALTRVAGSIAPMPAERVARSLLDGMERERPIIVPGAESKLLYLARRLFPELVFAVLDRKVIVATAADDVRGARPGR